MEYFFPWLNCLNCKESASCARHAFGSEMGRKIGHGRRGRSVGGNNAKKVGLKGKTSTYAIDLSSGFSLNHNNECYGKSERFDHLHSATIKSVQRRPLEYWQ